MLTFKIVDCPEKPVQEGKKKKPHFPYKLMMNLNGKRRRRKMNHIGLIELTITVAKLVRTPISISSINPSAMGTRIELVIDQVSHVVELSGTWKERDLALLNHFAKIFDVPPSRKAEKECPQTGVVLEVLA